MAHKVACQEALRDKAYLVFCGTHPGVTLDRTESISGHMFSHPANENNNTLAQPAFQHGKDHIRQHICRPLQAVQARETSTQSPAGTQRRQAKLPGQGCIHPEGLGYLVSVSLGVGRVAFLPPGLTKPSIDVDALVCISTCAGKGQPPRTGVGTEAVTCMSDQEWLGVTATLGL